MDNEERVKKLKELQKKHEDLKRKLIGAKSFKAFRSSQDLKLEKAADGDSDGDFYVGILNSSKRMLANAATSAQAEFILTQAKQMLEDFEQAVNGFETVRKTMDEGFKNLEMKIAEY